ncbi:hypothetical protein V2J09_010535 [Rumex salicifolius]
MSEFEGSEQWREEMTSLLEDHEIRYTADFFSSPIPSSDLKQTHFGYPGSFEGQVSEPENLKDKIKGFAESWGELLMDLSRGCKDILQQSLVDKDSYIVQKFGGPVSKVSGRLSFLNDYLPEDRDPVHAWPVILCVFVLALSVLNINNTQNSPIPVIKKMLIHPPSASHVSLPDGRRIAYQEQGALADRARFTMITPHAFLSSRLAGLPGVKESFLEDFGVRLITYDLPGFGESDPYPQRDLNSSAHDIMHLAYATGVHGKFWLLGHSHAAIHVWAALRYIPDRVAGAALVAPMINPYDRSMNKEETSRTWGNWEGRRKFMYFLARRFPSSLSYFYRKTFLSGNHGLIEKWLSISLAEKDKALIENPRFEENWQRNVEESIRQGSARPFIEEARLQVSDWGFSLTDLQMRRKCLAKGIFPWLKSMYTQAECELTGFPGPIHLWQGMDDRVVSSSMTDYISRVLPGATVHRLPNDGHFSYFYFCDECQKNMFMTLFGDPQGLIDSNPDDTRESSADQHRYDEMP